MVDKLLLKDKKVISGFLEISVRTLDRYVKKYDLSVYSEKGKKKLDLVEVLRRVNSDDLRQVETGLDSFRQFETEYVKGVGSKDFKTNQKTALDKNNVSETVGEDNIEKKPQNKGNESVVSFREKSNVEKFDLVDVSNLQKFQKESEIYKKLYEETVAELKIKQERLEGATYRVGQLESQIKNTVPLLTYRQKEEEVIQLHEIQKKEQELQSKQFKQLKRDVYESKLMKNVYTAILFGFLIIIPVLLIYFFNS